MKNFLIASFLLSALGLQAQLNLKGTIKDANDKSPIIGAIVYIPDLKKGANTDLSGNFIINNLPRGKFLVQIKMIGYNSFVKVIDMNKQETLEVLLSSTITELNEVVISGVGHSTELKKNPIPIATLSNDLLKIQTATNIIENITQEPGVYQISTGVAVGKPVIRGLSYNRVITLYDGVRQEGQQWGDEHGVEIDEFSVNKVEIIKGAGSLLYGSDGLGGVVNFLAPDPVAEGIVETKFTSNYQSNHGLIANSIQNAGNKKGFYWLGRVTQKDAHAYKNKFDGIVFNSGFNERDFNLTTGINRSWGFSQLNYSVFNQTVGLVEGNRDTAGRFTRPKNINGSEEEVTASDNDLESYSIDIPRQKINHTRISSTTNLFSGDARLQLNLGYQHNLRKEYGNVLNENQADLFFDLRTLSYNLTAYLPEINEWSFSLGSSGMWQQNQNKGLEFLIPEYSMFDIGGVFFAKRSFKKFDVAGGVRLDHRSITIDPLYLDDEDKPTNNVNAKQKFFSKALAFNNYSASAGFTYQFSNFVSMKLNGSRGFRAPNISELTSNGRHEGSLRYEYGNPNLKAETSFQGDFSLLINTPHISAEISSYQNHIGNYIYTKKLLSQAGMDSIPDPEEPVPAYSYVQGKARLTGGEISIDLHPHPLDWLHFENALSVVYASNLSQRNSGSKYLPFMPAPRLQSELKANAKKWKSFTNVFIKIQYQHYWHQNRVLLENGTETPTPSYSLWQTGCGLDVLGRKDKTIFSFYFTVVNLFDKAYQNNLSRLKYAVENLATGRVGVYNMGRNFSFKIVVPITYQSSHK
jgi:iron complex outermembrane receptor protein